MNTTYTDTQYSQTYTDINTHKHTGIHTQLMKNLDGFDKFALCFLSVSAYEM